MIYITPLVHHQCLVSVEKPGDIFHPLQPNWYTPKTTIQKTFTRNIYKNAMMVKIGEVQILYPTWSLCHPYKTDINVKESSQIDV